MIHATANEYEGYPGEVFVTTHITRTSKKGLQATQSTEGFPINAAEEILRKRRTTELSFGLTIQLGGVGLLALVTASSLYTMICGSFFLPVHLSGVQLAMCPIAAATFWKIGGFFTDSAAITKVQLQAVRNYNGKR